MLCGRSQVSITGVSGSQQASATLGLDVVQMAAPIARPFTTVGGSVERAFYDESRQLISAGAKIDRITPRERREAAG